MAEHAAPLSRTTIYLRLGRVSNLPTIWTNVAAAVTLSNGPVDASVLIPLSLAFSCFYLGGMFLNDAFDRDIDAIRRRERPIPAGLISAQEVFAVGFLLLFIAWAAITVMAGVNRPRASLAAFLLALAIVLYDASHRHALGPFHMGSCRGLIYVTVALAVGEITLPLTVGAILLTSYVTGLSLASKWNPGAHRTVATLISGIALLDALLILSEGHAALAAVIALGFPLTLYLQRRVRGT